MTAGYLGDLLASVAVFCLAWLFFFAAHLLAASSGLVRGIRATVVLIAGSAAVAAGLSSWFFMQGCFSTPDARLVASVFAPLSYAGFCGIYLLVGPITVDRSFTLMILRSLEANEPKGQTYQALCASIDFDRVMSKRLIELEGAGTLRTGEYAYITARGIRVLRLYRLIGRLFKVEFQ